MPADNRPTIDFGTRYNPSPKTRDRYVVQQRRDEAQEAAEKRAAAANRKKKRRAKAMKEYDATVEGMRRRRRREGTGTSTGTTGPTGKVWEGTE